VDLKDGSNTLRCEARPLFHLLRFPGLPMAEIATVIVRKN